MSRQELTPKIRRANDLDWEELELGTGVERAILLDESHGTPTFKLRRYRLAAGASVPKHTNKVEHEVYATAGTFIAGIDDDEHEILPGDSLLIPAGVVHWFRNESTEPAEFVCGVPNGETGTELVDE